MPTLRPASADAPRLAAGTGAVGGIIAAVVMAMLATVVSAAHGSGALAPVQLIGATFEGDVLAHPVRSTVVGVVLHMLVGAGLGALFGAATARLRSALGLMGTGLAYAAVVFVLMTFVVLPVVNPVMAGAVSPGWFFVYHLAFGLALPLTILVARRPRGRWFGDEQARA